MGYTPLGAGVHGLPWTAAPAVAAPIAGLLSDRIGGRRIVAIGVALQAVGIGWLAVVMTATTPYADLILPFLITGTGLGSSSRPSPGSPSATLPGSSRASPPVPPTRCARSAPCWASPCSARSSPPPAAWAALASSLPA
jgi:MFS family permease